MFGQSQTQILLMDHIIPHTMFLNGKESDLLYDEVDNVNTEEQLMQM